MGEQEAAMSISTRFMRKGYTIEDYKREEMLFNDYQSFLEKMFREKTESRKHLLLSYLLCYRYITAEQCLMLFDKDASKKKAEYVFLGRLEKEGLIRCVPAENDCNCKIYTLTASGKKYIGSVLENSSLDPTCISFMNSRLSRQKQMRHFAHNLSVHNMDIFLLSSGHTFLSSKEAVFRTDGQIVPFDDLLRGSLHEKGVIQADNYVILHGNGTKIYQEQDMATQRKEVIQEKIRKYILLCTAAGMADNIPVFTLNSDRLAGSVRTDADVSTAASHKRLLEGIALGAVACMRAQGDTSRYPDWRSLSLVDLDKFYVEIIQSVMEPRYAVRLKSVRKVFDLYLHEDVFCTVGGMLDQVSMQTKQAQHLEENVLNNTRMRCFAKRRETFREVSSSFDDFRSAAIKGMSLFAVSSYDIPGAFLTGFHGFSDHLIREFAPLCGILEPDSSVYTPMETAMGNISFRNRYAFSGNRILYLEDISADLGGMERLRYYVRTFDHKDKGYLICLLDDSDREYVRHMLDGSRYASSPGEGRLLLSFYSADAFRNGSLVSLKYNCGSPFSQRTL